MESSKNIWYIGLGIGAVAAIILWLLREHHNLLRVILYTLLSLGSVFIILLVLIQRGRGGGLAGALGGMGGYSAFGTRAGDIFTRVTIVAAALWLLAAMALAKINLGSSQIYENPGVAAPSSSQTPGAGASIGGREEAGEDEPGSTPSESTQPKDSKGESETDSQSR